MQMQLQNLNEKNKMYKHYKKNKTPQKFVKVLTIILLMSMLSSSTLILVHATPLFEDDFESGSFSAWTTTYSSSGQSTQITTDKKYSGTYGAEFLVTNENGYHYAQTTKNVNSMSELYARAYINVDVNGLDDSEDKLYFIRFTAGNDNVLWAGWRRSGSNIRWQLLIRDGSGYVSEYTETIPNTNQWYNIETYWKNDGRDGEASLWVNGNQMIHIDNQDTNNYGDVTEVQFGVAEAYRLDYTRVYGDNFAISQEYIGPFESAPTSTDTQSSVGYSTNTEDFESNDLENWNDIETTYGETVSVERYDSYQGTYHARFSSNGNSGTENAYLSKDIDQETVYAAGYFNIVDGLPLYNENDRLYLIRIRANGQSIAGIGIRQESNQLQWAAYGRDAYDWVWPGYSETPRIVEDQWYKIELYWHKSNNGYLEVFVNNNRIFLIDNVNTETLGSADEIQMGLVHGYSLQNDMIIYGDNFEIATDNQNTSEEPSTTINQPYTPPTSSTSSNDVHFGWGGYISSTRDVIPILDDLESDGYNAIRYWARPYWYYHSSYHSLDYDVLDLLVTEANKRDITVYIDCEHNYPPTKFINYNNRDQWINDVITVGKRYNNFDNVVLEPINEYSGNDQVELYNWGMAKIRAAGVHLPLLWNFWWNQPNAQLKDPDNNYAIGRHLYGGGYTDYDPYSPGSLEYAVQRSGIDDSMYRYFDDPRQSLYLQSVLDLDIPNGWVISEMGPAESGSGIDDPSVGNMAYAMQFMREAAEHGVSVICYRIGDVSKKSLYETRARQYFNEEFFNP